MGYNRFSGRRHDPIRRRMAWIAALVISRCGQQRGKGWLLNQPCLSCGACAVITPQGLKSFSSSLIDQSHWMKSLNTLKIITTNSPPPPLRSSGPECSLSIKFPLVMPSDHNIGQCKKTKTRLVEHNSHKSISSTHRGQDAEGSCRGSSSPSFKLQQLLLNLFKDAFANNFNDTLPLLIQEVKQHLFHREFHNAFGKESLLKAYAIRWSSVRALVYLDVFHHLPQISATFRSCSGRENQGSETANDTASPAISTSQGTVQSLDEQNNPQSTPTGQQDNNLRIVCLGGGAGAELVALGAYLSFLNSSTSKDPGPEPREKSKPAKLDMTAVDVADWSSVTNKLYAGITTEPPLPKYASATAQMTTQTALADRNACRMLFLKHDLLHLDADQTQAIFRDALLVTLMFTLNELYSTSIGATTNLLLSITSVLNPGALLLVVDSPGSYSTVDLGPAAAADAPGGKKALSAPKKYPMQWLLDHTLLEAATVASSSSGGQVGIQQKRWEKLHSDDSAWFRLPPGLAYPVRLEDMRYQIHLYRRS